MTAAIHSPGLSAEIWGLLVESLIMEWRALLMLCGLMLTAMSGAFTQYVQTSGSPLLNTFWLLAILFMILSVVVTHIFSVHIARYSNENRGRAWRANFGGLPRWADIYMLLALPRVLLLWGVIMLITGIYIYIFDKWHQHHLHRTHSLSHGHVPATRLKRASLRLIPVVRSPDTI